MEHRGEAIGQTWIDRIELETRAPGGIAADTSADPVAELGALIHGTVLKGDAFRDDVREMVQELLDELPVETRRLAGNSEAEFDAFLDRLMDESGADVIARLKGPAAEDAA